MPISSRGQARVKRAPSKIFSTAKGEKKREGDSRPISSNALSSRQKNNNERKAAFQKALLAWYSKGHRELPWRKTRDPYSILVSEVMLQQTQADRVTPKYLEWLKRFPTFQALAAAPVADVIRAWSGLGYNQRAVRLHTNAQRIAHEFGGKMPRDIEAIRTFKGIGDYTAAAVACFAFDSTKPVVDTNVRRVLSRVFLEGTEASAKEIDALAHAVIPVKQAYDWNQAMMELGAVVCFAKAPRCGVCPVRLHCAAAPTIQSQLLRIAEAKATYKTQPFKESRRYFRGRVVEHLRSLPHGEGATLARLGPLLKGLFWETESAWLVDLVTGLERDGLVAVRTDGKGEVVVGLP